MQSVKTRCINEIGQSLPRMSNLNLEMDYLRDTVGDTREKREDKVYLILHWVIKNTSQIRHGFSRSIGTCVYFKSLRTPVSADVKHTLGIVPHRRVDGEMVRCFVGSA